MSMKFFGGITATFIITVLLSLFALFIPPSVSAISIVITGPKAEDQNNLPSTQANPDIWYNISISGLEPNKGYHLKIYKTAGYSPPSEGAEAAGTESLCGLLDSSGNKMFDKEAISNSEGKITAKMKDSLLPDNPPIGNFIFEVATASESGIFQVDCVRSDYVAHTNITIVETPQDYNPGSSPGSGQNPCVGGVCNTALGNIPTSAKGFAQSVLNIATGLAGGLALILMVIGSVKVLTSSGDQQKLAGGRDMIVGAVAGLLFLIFSVLILRFIGVEILNIQFFR